MCALLEDLLRAEAQALAQLGGGSSGSGGSISADPELHEQLLRYLLPAHELTRSPVSDCLASNGLDLGSEGASQLLGLLVAMLKGVPTLLLQQADPAFVQMGVHICAATLKVAAQMVAQAAAPVQQDGSDAAAAAVLPWLVLLGRCCL